MEQWKLMLEAHNCGLLRSSMLLKHAGVNVGDHEDAVCGQRNNREEGTKGSVVTLYNVLKHRVQQAAQAAHAQISPARRKPGRALRTQSFAPPSRQMEEATTSSGSGGRCNIVPSHLEIQIPPNGLQQPLQPTQIKQPIQTPNSQPSVNSGPVTEPPQNGGLVSSLSDFYSIDWTPKEFYVKFRQQLNGYQVAANFEIQHWEKAGLSAGCSSPHQVSLFGYQAHGCNTKLVLKPLGDDRLWKIICEPKQHDVRFLTKKIPIGPLFNLQLGVGHDYENNVTGWKWKLTTSLGGSSVSQIQHKTLFPICPGFDVRFVWNAEYQLPAVHGGLGSGEPEVGMDLGHLSASLEKLEAIVTRCS